MEIIYTCDRDDGFILPPLQANTGIVKYKCANTRKCYWLCRGCLKGHNKCSYKCLDYLSVAVLKRMDRLRRGYK